MGKYIASRTANGTTRLIWDFGGSGAKVSAPIPVEAGQLQNDPDAEDHGVYGWGRASNSARATATWILGRALSNHADAVPFLVDAFVDEFLVDVPDEGFELDDEDVDLWIAKQDLRAAIQAAESHGDMLETHPDEPSA